MWCCPEKVGFCYTHNLNPCAVRVTNTLMKGNLLSFSFLCSPSKQPPLVQIKYLSKVARQLVQLWGWIGVWAKLLSLLHTRHTKTITESKEQQCIVDLLPQSNLLLSRWRPPHFHMSSDNLCDFVKSDSYKKSWEPSWISSFPGLILNDSHMR